MKLITRFLSFAIIISLLPNIVSAQASAKEIYFKHWTRSIETKEHIDINYRIIQCGINKPQLHLQVYNESKIDQVIKFQVIISQENGKYFTTEILLDTKKASSYVAWCDSDLTTDKLKITIPEGYKPEEVSVKINTINTL